MKLQPHFLFNTLNSISFLAVEKDVDGVVTMVERLAALLRSSMQVAGSQLVAVGEELALAISTWPSRRSGSPTACTSPGGSPQARRTR